MVIHIYINLSAVASSAFWRTFEMDVTLVWFSADSSQAD